MEAEAALQIDTRVREEGHLLTQSEIRGLPLAAAGARTRLRITRTGIISRSGSRRGAVDRQLLLLRRLTPQA